MISASKATNDDDEDEDDDSEADSADEDEALEEDDKKIASTSSDAVRSNKRKSSMYGDFPQNNAVSIKDADERIKRAKRAN